MKLQYLTAMVDVSRNSVLTIEECKKFMVALKKMGYNSFVLYTEDLYEMPEYPLFGYLRGKYSKQDLKDLVSFGESVGITVMPSIQVLAHLVHIFRWRKAFGDVHDSGDVLLADEPKTYELIENMIKTMREIFSTDVIHFGCDEAESLGLGQFLNKNGYEDPKTIFTRHVNRCAEIAHKYGFKPHIYGDMYFKLASNGELDWHSWYTDKEVITPEFAKSMPKNSYFGYWDYFSPENIVRNMMKECKKFGVPIWFSASVISWRGCVTHNKDAMAMLKESIPAVVEMGADSVSIIAWGDDGGEASVWAYLPTWFYAAQLANGITDIEEIKRNFKNIFNMDMDNFMKLDVTSDYTGVHPTFHSEKVFVFNDPFLGIYDDIVPEDTNAFRTRFQNYAVELAELANKNEFGYLFQASSALCELLAVKFDLGKKTRKIYHSGEKEDLLPLIEDYQLAYDKASAFFDAFRTLWYKERKGNGFEVQAIRYGGLKERLMDCKQRLQEFYDGKIDSIPELEEEILHIHTTTDLSTAYYGQIVSPNTITHYNFYGI